MIYLVAVLVYLFGLAILAMSRAGKVKTEDDFAVAGRSLSPWIMVCTMLAVWIGTGSIVGNAERTYKDGMAALVLPTGTFIGMILLSLIAARARNIEASSVPEIIGGRFGQIARALAVISLIIAYMVIVSYQFNAGGAVLEVITEGKLDAKAATIIAAAFIILFTMLAGLMSLAYMDIVTGIIIIVTLLITFPMYWFRAGGWSGMQDAFMAQGRAEHMQFWGVYPPVTLINFCLPVFLLVLGDANQYQRIFASRNAKGATTAVTVMIFAALAIELLIIGCAWISSSMTPDPENGKYILIYAARHYLPLPLGCLFMITVVGIITSTANSFLLVPSTTFITDVYLNYINPKANEKRTIFLSRLLVVVFGIIAYLVSLAFSESTGFFEKALYAFTIYGASITPSLVAAIVWPRATKAGAISSIVSGTVMALLWSEADALRNQLPGDWSDLDAVLPAITVSTLSLIVVSLLTRPSTAKTPMAE
ncbi:MAG: sodium:solute symporter family protein [Sedimentisphaerales bacterium]|nr:sodium:solute symporter family protein [Sedimentisphaerales bacterium]